MTASADWIIYVRARGEVAADHGDGLTFDLSGKDTQNSPAPVVRVNGDIVTSGYTFNAGSQSTNSSITFGSSQTGNIVTADYRWKYECSYDEEPSVYELDEPVGVTAGKDANGRDLVAISYSPSGRWRGLFTAEYVPKAFYDMFKAIKRNAWLFDIECPVNPDSTMNNMIILDGPKWAPHAGVPDRFTVGLTIMKVAD